MMNWFTNLIDRVRGNNMTSINYASMQAQRVMMEDAARNLERRQREQRVEEEYQRVMAQRERRENHAYYHTTTTAAGNSVGRTETLTHETLQRAYDHMRNDEREGVVRQDTMGNPRHANSWHHIVREPSGTRTQTIKVKEPFFNDFGEWLIYKHNKKQYVSFAEIAKDVDDPLVGCEHPLMFMDEASNVRDFTIDTWASQNTTINTETSLRLDGRSDYITIPDQAAWAVHAIDIAEAEAELEADV